MTEALKLAINSIFGGQSDTWNLAAEDQFLISLGIDPEATSGSLVKPLGVIMPTRTTKFSSSELTSVPMWISGAPTTASVYVYGADGTLLSYNQTLSGETGIGSVAGYGGAGNGMAIYNDYVYLSTASTISRYGRLSQSGPTMQFDFWVAGLTMSALTNSDYPATRNVTYPNHVLYPHNDGRVYVLDYDGKNGRIHSFTTDDTGASSSGTFNDLTLPPGLMPMDAKAYGTDIAILLSPQATYVQGAVPKPGRNAVLALWDGNFQSKPYRYVDINEPLATALVNKNGELFVLAGNIDANVKLMRYLGGYSFETVVLVNEGSPPPAGAADSNGNMVAWGGHVTYPSMAAGAFTYGFRNGRLGRALNHIMRISDTTSTLPIVSALRFIQRSVFPVLGWRTDTPGLFGLEKIGGTGAYGSVYRSRVFNLNRKFRVRRVKFGLTAAVAAGMGVTPTFYVDNEVASYTAGAAGIVAVNNTNYAKSERLIDMTGLSVEGENNFYFELAFNGTTEVGVTLPIEFELEML